MDENSLIHYGVLGMRWGVRKARKKGIDYVYKSKEQKNLERYINGRKQKGRSVSNKLQNQLGILKIRDGNRQNYAEDMRIGEMISRNLLMGPFGKSSYDRFRASGMSSKEARKAIESEDRRKLSKNAEFETASKMYGYLRNLKYT